MARTGKTKNRRKGRKKWRRIGRIGSVSIYRRGPTYHLYYRENGRSLKVPVGRGLNEARRLASEVNAQLRNRQPTTFGFDRISIADFRKRWISHCKDVLGVSYETERRYDAAFGHFVGFAENGGVIQYIDEVTPAVMAEFLKHMRTKNRTNGSCEMMTLLAVLLIGLVGICLLVMLLEMLTGDGGRILKWFGVLLMVGGTIAGIAVLTQYVDFRILKTEYDPVFEFLYESRVGLFWAILILLASLLSGSYYYRSGAKGVALRSLTKVAVVFKVLGLLTLCWTGIFLCAVGPNWGDGLGAALVAFFGTIVAGSLYGLGVLVLAVDVFIARRTTPPPPPP